ncbi:MAG TPA: nucleoside triphosphate pyrophosphohydrolase [Actinomycetota bacterium]|nr:nucleoside triphosphate pyrophosphohydrolase [Actinomycetota bacterium]
MPLLVVVAAPDEAGSVTLSEWDALSARERVLFEREDHPLIARLTALGIAAGPFDDEPVAGDDRTALVADPGSVRIVELARAGAEIRSGAVEAPDMLTVAHGSRVARRASRSLGGLAVVMARLRSADGCPWDQEQTHESLRVHLVEEAYEVLDAIDRGALTEDLEEELGDLLLQVYFHAQLAADDGRFDVAEVAERLVAKLVHRHPHVFGDIAVSGAGEVVRNWESIKAAEKERSGAFDDVPAGLPALLYSSKIQKRAASLGFHPTEEEALGKLSQAVAELSADPQRERFGEVLFWFVALARALGIDPEGALRAAAVRFRDSF